MIDAPTGGLDLAATSVFLDFDGTISTTDVGVHLLERLAPASWREVEVEYQAGVIGSRVCLLDEWDLLPRDPDLLRSVAAEVALDPGTDALVAGLLAAGAEVSIVSDGFGFYARDACAHLGIPLLTNAVDWATGRLEFPHEDRCCACSSCGTCKQAPIKDARRRGRATVLVGDGTSDRKAALLADLVFAKDDLARWCDRNDVRFERFATLADVRGALLPVNVVLGSDERTGLTDAVVEDLRARGHEVALVGSPGGETKEWADVGREVGEAVARGDAGTGVVFCWTGTGASIAANKVHGVRAALCADAATAAGARRWNDANVLVLSLRLTSPEVAREMLDAWFSTASDPSEAVNIARLEPG